MSLILIANNITKDPSRPDVERMLSRPDGTSDYDVEVSINRERFIWCGTIAGHKRDSGAAVLLRRIADAIDAHNAKYLVMLDEVSKSLPAKFAARGAENKKRKVRTSDRCSSTGCKNKRLPSLHYCNDHLFRG